ncbi:MBL fold metallo-hydrolase [Methanocalculus sp.]|uniref:MBL fold metallo-hydrolase n=1 Tax=Methanocalculus sp. TaxID=2004547 RepID=UPI00272750B7|nr:MBL fold metallo-hydrolase [Methanocalculus sp.]MDO8842406.1 MBL fold metallo-hydrolase [Methanocalculus sp.]
MDITMEITLLGTGDAIGTPKIGCSCDVCTTAWKEGRERLRTSLLIRSGSHHLIIDTSPDLRRQLLHAGSPHIDAGIWTHGHYDHFMGFGDFYRVQKPPAMYGAPEVLEYCGDIFSFLPFPCHPVDPFSPFTLFDLSITLFPVSHPGAPTYGIRVESEGGVLVYSSDTRRDIPQESIACMKGADVLILDSMAPSGLKIPKHMNYTDAIDLATELKPKDFRFVHMSHMISWDLPHTGSDMEIFTI